MIYYQSLTLRALENKFYLIAQRHCFAVDCGESPMSVHTDDSCLTMKPVPRYQTTVGSAINYACASLLTSLPVSHISYCPVQTCLEKVTWGNVSLSCARKSNNLDLVRIRNDRQFTTFNYMFKRKGRDLTQSYNKVLISTENSKSNVTSHKRFKIFE